MAYRKKATSLEDFEPTEKTSSDDLLKLTLENSQAIFVHHRGFNESTGKLRWVMHEDFIPPSLQGLRTPGMDHSKSIKGEPFDVPLEVTATVGEYAEFFVWPVHFPRSISVVASIAPCAYRDAYHDDLELATLVVHI